jgi:putative heme-binding domain-containing protein
MLLVAASQLVAQPNNEPAKKNFFLPKSATAAAYVLGRLSNQELIEAPRGEFVYVALLQRKGLDRKYRVEALEGLAKLRNTNPLTELLGALGELDKKGDVSETVLRDLSPILLLTKSDELKSKRPALEKLATEAQLPLARQISFAAMVTGDGGLESAWIRAETNRVRLIDLVLSVELIRNSVLRSLFYPKVEALLHKGDSPELRQAAISVIPAIPGHESESFKTLAVLVQSGTEKSVALASLQRIPKNFWRKENTQPLLDSLMADLPKAPTDQRSEPAFVNAVQFAKDLASLLPVEEAVAIGRILRGLVSSVFILRTIPEQMLYDQNLLVVEAGKPVEIILQNDDAMPHNLVITKPGAAEEVGNASERMSLTPDAQGRLYVPNLPRVLHATAMVESGRRAKLAFIAPTEPGDYPYLCSFPGHWRRMLGTLAVVNDVEKYLATRAATAPKITEWKIGDFTTDIYQTNSPRNFPRGKELFTKATCASCHKLGGEGYNFGPDLTEVFKRYNNDRAAVLRQILEPSLVISNRYRNVRFALKDGEDVTGLIMKEDAATITVQTGPTESLIQTLAKLAVQEQQPRDLSPMPLGLLNQLSKEEIFDLLAWIETGGNAAPHDHAH